MVRGETLVLSKVIIMASSFFSLVSILGYVISLSFTRSFLFFGHHYGISSNSLLGFVTGSRQQQSLLESEWLRQFRMETDGRSLHRICYGTVR